MMIRDLMARDNVGCRGMRRNSARLSYRMIGHAGRVAANSHRPDPAPTAEQPRRFTFGPFHVETPRRVAKPAPVETVESNVVALDDAAAKARAAKDRKNKAARDRRAAAKIAA